MFQAARGFKKEDLLFVAEEIGVVLPEKVTISDLKALILNSKEFVEDPEFVKSILLTTINERNKREDNNQRLLEYEQKKLVYKQKEIERQQERELAMLGIFKARLPVPRPGERKTEKTSIQGKLSKRVSEEEDNVLKNVIDVQDELKEGHQVFLTIEDKIVFEKKDNVLENFNEVQKEAQLENIEMNSVAEFCCARGEITTYGMSGSPVGEGEDMMDLERESEMEEFIQASTEVSTERKFDFPGWKCINPSESIISQTHIQRSNWNGLSDTLAVRDATNGTITKMCILDASNRVFDPGKLQIGWLRVL